MTLELTAAPAAEPVSVSDAKDWLRISHAADDALILSLIRAAREHVETRTGLALITQSWRERLEDWPRDRLSASGLAVQLKRAPLISVEAVRVRGRNGDLTDWNSAEYRVETGEPGRWWPSCLRLATPGYSSWRHRDRLHRRLWRNAGRGSRALARGDPASGRGELWRGPGRGRREPPAPDMVDRLLAPFERVRL